MIIGMATKVTEQKKSKNVHDSIQLGLRYLEMHKKHTRTTDSNE